jgi:hypothetical protein
VTRDGHSFMGMAIKHYEEAYPATLAA